MQLTLSIYINIYILYINWGGWTQIALDFIGLCVNHIGFTTFISSVHFDDVMGFSILRGSRLALDQLTCGFVSSCATTLVSHYTQNYYH